MRVIITVHIATLFKTETSIQAIVHPMCQLDIRTSGSNPYNRGRKIWSKSYDFKMFKGNDKIDFYLMYLGIYKFPAYKAKCPSRLPLIHNNWQKRPYA